MLMMPTWIFDRNDKIIDKITSITWPNQGSITYKTINKTLSSFCHKNHLFPCSVHIWLLVKCVRHLVVWGVYRHVRCCQKDGTHWDWWFLHFLHFLGIGGGRWSSHVYNKLWGIPLGTLGTFKIPHKCSNTTGWTIYPFILQTLYFHLLKFHPIGSFFRTSREVS